MRAVTEILVVELLGGLGDVLLVLPAVHALAAAHPGARLRVLTFEPGARLLEEDPAVFEVIGSTDHSEGAPRAAVEEQLRRCPPDLVVSTTRYGGIGELLAGLDTRVVADLWRSPPADELVDLRFLRLLAAEGLIAPDAAAPPRVALRPAELADARALVAGAPRPVLLLPGAGMPVKRWPLDRWQELARQVAAAGRSVLSVAPEPELAGLLPGAVPPLSLRGLAALCAAVGERGGAVVGADTGPVRLAGAVGAPAVCLFGPTVAGRYGLRGGAVNLQGLPDCPVRRPSSITEQECWWAGHCPLTGGPPACMADLSVTQVHAALQSIG